MPGKRCTLRNREAYVHDDDVTADPPIVIAVSAEQINEYIDRCFVEEHACRDAHPPAPALREAANARRDAAYMLLGSEMVMCRRLGTERAIGVVLIDRDELDRLGLEIVIRPKTDVKETPAPTTSEDRR